MSVILSCLYEATVKWLRWKLTLVLCRSIYHELKPEESIMKGDVPYSADWEGMPLELYKAECLGTHFTKFVVYMMWLSKFEEREGRRHYESIRRRYGWSVPSLLRLLWHRLLLVWYKETKPKQNRHPSRDINGYPLKGEDVCP